jgi:FAD/FMN-containing dehydrogenase
MNMGWVVSIFVPLVGAAAHQRAVASLQASYRALPGGSPVRLAKRTSNLFRSPEKSGGGLDVSTLGGVIEIDEQARTADVQGMCTYEDLVAQTLAHGLMPLVVPQLKTITLGGAVTGLGIESSSLRNGLPHESVLEMDILTGSGQVVTASELENSDLFSAFPNSYGSLGYATRLHIRLEPVTKLVALRHLPFTSLDELAAAVSEIAGSGEWRGTRVDFIDGVMFDPAESYLTLGHWSERGTPSDYTRQQIYYRSIQKRDADSLTVHDYLWRWDTDWFWCSAAFGAQNPLVRRVWPRRWRRSDVYHRILRLENRYGIAGRVERWRGQPDRERLVQDVELPLEQTADFLRWFTREVGMSPVWLCPLRSRRTWPLYPLEPGRVYVNVGFWGTVPIRPGGRDGDMNRAVEQAVADFGGHKSLYSDVYYDKKTFDALYGGEALQAVKQKYDPDGRLSGMYEKVAGSQ